ncbi:DUF2087 domain-containing protein [Salinispira pacifica]|uniref:DUF2087 domain-containing protein n=1 Tax=Salinispira pacifica TaxID=1307761 RepID=UPI00146F9E27|nr:DUF2087 domain-containing protein [Salinispira pacifica]
MSIVYGYSYDAKTQMYRCIHCGESFESGYLYSCPGDGGKQRYCDAQKAAELHSESAHGDRLTALLEMGKSAHGLSGIQQQVIRGMADGISDRELGRELGNRAASTVRNHRFNLQKKRREARMFLAIMELADMKRSATNESNRPEQGAEELLEIHHDMPMADDRVLITTAEAREIEEKHLDRSSGIKLLKFPRKEKAKLVILKVLAGLFEKDRVYSDGEVTEILKPVFSDVATIRRYLVEYNFIFRDAAGREYRRNNSVD